MNTTVIAYEMHDEFYVNRIIVFTQTFSDNVPKISHQYFFNGRLDGEIITYDEVKELPHKIRLYYMNRKNLGMKIELPV